MSNVQESNFSYLKILQGVVSTSTISTTSSQRRKHGSTVATDADCDHDHGKDSGDSSPPRKRRLTALKKSNTAATTTTTATSANSSRNSPLILNARDIVSDATAVGSHVAKTRAESPAEARTHKTKSNKVTTAPKTVELVDESPTLDDAVAAALLKSLNKAPISGMKTKENSTKTSKHTASKSTSAVADAAAATTSNTTAVGPSMLSVNDTCTGEAALTAASSKSSNPSILTAATAAVPPPPHPCCYSDADVLLGKGGLSNNHPGNKAYVAKALSMQEEYKNLPMHEKTRMSRELVNFVHDRGGRFMVKPQSSHEWVEVDFTTARKKASRLLRGDARRNPEDGTYTVKPVGALETLAETGGFDGFGSALGSRSTANFYQDSWYRGESCSAERRR